MRGIGTLGFALVAAGAVAAQLSYEAQRTALVHTIDAQVRATRSHTGRARLDARVRTAIGRVPRHEFVPESLRAYAYDNRPLPIGAGQTVSQPYIVALMTELADLRPDARVLEIGTGSGYQAAVLAEIAAHVHTIEIIEMLGQRARHTLERLGYRNVTVRIGDGYRGWPDAAPFDAILVTAAPETVPQPLIEQLKVGGRLVIPVGPQERVQSLQVIEKRPDGTVSRTSVLPVQFVPLTRD
ncbi:MAG: protein-L-isoaspartate(D-aspartate) O-methyltransferase [Gammaproteobacteria bacterium]|nr:protein-L-isoaspartate(D-aspartate) O-methyltransferase [Gammaproteobacteria bacterium]